jgi:hypothetical protein
MVIQAEMETWSKFRRGLRQEDQEALDELFRAARMQLASSAYAARPIPFESIVMSMLIMQQRMIRELQRHLAVEKPAEVANGYIELDEKVAYTTHV